MRALTVADFAIMKPPFFNKKIARVGYIVNVITVISPGAYRNRHLKQQAVCDDL
jgi:hypothetical protein